MGLLFLTTKHRIRVVGLAFAALSMAALPLFQAIPARADSTDQAAASSDTGRPADQQIDLDIVNANLLSVVRMLRMKSGAQIVVAGGDQSYRPVTLTVSGSLSSVLHYVAVSADATVTKGSDGVYVFHPADSQNAADTASASTDSANTDNAAPAQDPSAAPATTRPIGPMHYERIVLHNVDPDFILTMINDPSGYRDTNPYHDRKMQDMFGDFPANDRPDITEANPSINMLNPNGQPTTQPAAAEQPSVPMGNGPDGTSSAMTANRSAVQIGSEANQFVTPGGGGFFPGGGFNGGGGRPGQVGGPGFPGGPGGANGQGASLRPQGINSIIANEQDNSLLVQGDAEGIAELKQIVALLDVPPKQVQIKVEFITANVTDVDNFGINWDIVPFPNVEAGTQQGGNLPTGGTFLSFAQGNIVARLFTFLSTGRGKNISSPIISTTNNTPGAVFENIQIPYVTTTTVAGATGGAIQGNTVNFLNIRTGLFVTPRVNGDNSVTLVLSPSLSVPGTAVIANGPPPVTTEFLTTTRTVANGETMVLGGLVTKNETNTTIRVPILGDLPIIGGLFRTRSLNVNNSELLIFVTPTVLPSPGVAANLSGAPPGAETSGGIGVTP
jgi:type II secretory pathway component GspD/PulD (secretin)